MTHSVFVPIELLKCYNLIVFESISDTRPEIATLQRNLMRQAGSAHKLAIHGQMNQAAKHWHFPDFGRDIRVNPRNSFAVVWQIWF